MELLGQYIEGLKFPVCDKFSPTVMDGQLCYTLDLNSFLKPEDRVTIKGKRGELMLLLDYNKERSIRPTQGGEEKTNKKVGKHLSLADVIEDPEQEARVYIHTLKTQSEYGAGTYSLSSLKLMSATEAFAKLPDTTKGCKQEDREYCRKKKFIANGKSLCKCTPWEFPRETGSKEVRNQLHFD